MTPPFVTTTTTTTTNSISNNNNGGLVYPITGVAAAPANGNNNNTIQLRLRISAMNLPRPKRRRGVHVVVHRRRGRASASAAPDAVCCLVTGQQTGEIWGQTEAIRGGGGSHSRRHPHWTRTCLIQYEYGTTVHFYAHVFLIKQDDDDNNNERPPPPPPCDETNHYHHNHHRRNSSILSTTSATSQGSNYTQQQRISLGTALFEVGDILGSVYQTKIKRLRAGGCIICHLETCHSNQILELQFRMTTPLVMPHDKRRRRRMVVFLQSSLAEPNTILEIAKRPTTTRRLQQQQQQRPPATTTTTQHSSTTTATITTTPRSGTTCSPPQSPTPSDRRVVSSFSWITIWRSQPVVESLQPAWDCAQIDVGVLLSENHDDDDDDDFDQQQQQQQQPWKQQTLRLSVKECAGGGSGSGGGGDQLIGVAETTVGHLLEAARHQTPLFLQRSDIKFKPVGQLQVMRARILKEGTIPLSNDDVTITAKPSIAATATAAIATPMNTRTNIAAADADACAAGDDDDDDAVAASEMFAEVVDLALLQPLAAPMTSTTTTNNNNMATATATPSKPFSYYVQQGLDIDFSVAIDFTSSNGDPRVPTSYHYQGGNDDDCLNDYEETILTIGKALAQYNKTQEYTVWGFGAKFHDQIRHIFQCGPTPVVHGVQGILQAYQSVFASDLTMSGPTEFLQVLQAGAARAKRIHDQLTSGSNPQQLRLKYMVLLIITDGVMHNSEETRRKLQVYSFLPLSVIFVGVGRSSFDALKGLCSTARSNTTFVEFRHQQHSPTALGQAALQNIPQQICSYMQSRGL